MNLIEGVRSSVATSAIVLLSAWLGQPTLLSAALAAWLVCLADAGGPMRKRVPVLIGFVLIGAFLTGAVGLLRAAPEPVVIVVASALIFCTSFARVWGQPQLQAGNLLSIVIVLALREPIPNLAAAVTPVVMFLIGGGWAILIALVLWPIYPHLPARRAVAGCNRALADLVGDLAGLVADPTTTTETWDTHLRARRRVVRDNLEQARGAVLSAARSRGPIAGRTRENLIRLEATDQIFGALIGLSDQLESGVDPATRAAALRILRVLRPVLGLLGAYVVSEAPKRLERLERAVAQMEALAPPGSPLHAATARIADLVRIAITLAADDGQLATIEVTPLAPLRDRIITPVRANLSFGSSAFLHALRVTVAAVIAFAVTLTWPTDYVHWLTITLLLTIQPFWALTFTRAAERMGGTVLGGALAAALLYFFGSTVSLAVAMFPLTLIAFALRTVSFGLFITCVTPIVVLLSEVATAPGNALEIAEMRALYTILGGLLALAAGYFLWPSWEPGRMLQELRTAILAHGRFALAELAAVLGEAPLREAEKCRRAAGLASNNVETSLQRMTLEPRSNRATVEAAMTVDAALRRMAGRLSALQLDPGQGHDPASWHAWRDWIETATRTLADFRTRLPPRPPLPPNDRQAAALTRIARQLELAATALGRMGPGN